MPDDFDSLVADRCHAVDDVPVPADLWWRVQFKVVDMPVQFNEEETTMIDLKAPSHTGEQRKHPKRVLVAGLLAAAAVAAIAIVAIRDDEPVSPADQPSPTVTVPPTLAPQALLGTPEDQVLPPGTYFVDQVEGTTTPRIFVTLNEGWENMGGPNIGKNDVGIVTFHRLDSRGVYADACHAGEGIHPGPMTTLDGVVAALSEQAGWARVTAPSDISVNGYPGKTFQRTAPADFTDCNPGNAAFKSWSTSWYEPNEIETLRVFDVNGSIILINSRLKPDHQDDAAAAGLAAVLDSIRVAQV